MLHFLLHLVVIRPQFLQPVTDENIWRQFDKYALRVHRFTHRCCDSPNYHEDIPPIHPSVYLLLARTKRYLFPNLRTLRAATDQYTTPIELIFCITHTFELAPSNERYGLTDATYAVGTTLDMLTTANGDMPSVHIHYLELRAVVPVESFDKLLSLTKLRSLRVNGINWEHKDSDDVASDYILHLSKLPHLQDLLLSIQEGEAFLPAYNDGFPSLKRLTIQSSGPSLESFFSALLKWNTRVSGLAELRSRLEAWSARFAALERQAKTLASLRIT